MQVGMLQHDLTKEWWKNRETPYSKEYVSHMDQAIAGEPDWRPEVTARES